jgi:hypothetical protein
MSQNDAETTTAVAQNGVSGAVTADDRARVERFINYLTQRSELAAATRGNDVAYKQMARIIEATESGTDDDIWDADEGGVVSGKDFAGIEFMLHAIEFSPSSDQYDAPLGHFVTLNTTVLSKHPGFSIGEEVIVNTGAPGVVTKARALEARGMLPAPCFIKSVPARKGSVLKLRPAPGHAVTGETAE